MKKRLLSILELIALITCPVALWASIIWDKPVGAIGPAFISVGFLVLKASKRKAAKKKSLVVKEAV